MIGNLPFFLIAMGISLVLTPLVRAFALRAKILDLPAERKIHKMPVPLLGGVSIFLAFNMTIFIGFVLNHSLIAHPFLSRWEALFLCQSIILALGFLDDRKHLPPSTKFLFQLVVGALIISFGFGIRGIANPVSGHVVNLGIFSIPLTMLWLIGITNALNLVDGLDGLAAGTSLIVSMTICAIGFIKQDWGLVFITLSLAGSITGFLRYNFYPAKIFLGDSGSLLLGFLLAVISIQGSSKGPTLVAVLAPILVLGFPIMETLLSMIRRFLRSLHIIDYPSKNGHFRAIFFGGFTLFEADKDHVHHRLLKKGFSQRKAVIILYIICVALSVLAFLTVAFKNINQIAILGAILIAFYIGIRSLKYQEFKILENGLLIPLFNFPIINKSVFQAFFDLAMIVFSYYLSFLLVFKDLAGAHRVLFVRSFPIVILVKIIVFYLSSMYKSSWLYSSLEDALMILKAIMLSSLSTIVVLSLFFPWDSFGGIVIFVLDFYLLLTFVAGFRISYRIFNSYYKRSFGNRGKKILIYGAGYRGSTVLKEIRNNEAYSYSPAGFIDDAPEKIGKSMSGVPVLGSIDDLDNITKENEVAEIIVSTAKIGRDKIKRLIEFCERKGIIARLFEFRFYEFP